MGTGSLDPVAVAKRLVDQVKLSWGPADSVFLVAMIHETPAAVFDDAEIYG